MEQRWLGFRRSAVLLLLSFLFLFLHRAGIDAPWRTGVFATLRPGLFAVRQVETFWRQSTYGWTLLTTGGAHLAELEAELGRLRGQEDRAQVLEQQNTQLRLELGTRPADQAILGARFYGFRDHWYIDRGCRDGVSGGETLFREGNLVGEVAQVYPNYALVRTLRDPSWRLPVSVGTESARGLFQSARGVPEVTEIPIAQAVGVGESVMTLGSAGLRPDLAVGRVLEISETAGSGVRSATLVLHTEPESIEMVYLLPSGEGCP